MQPRRRDDAIGLWDRGLRHGPARKRFVDSPRPCRYQRLGSGRAFMALFVTCREPTCCEPVLLAWRKYKRTEKSRWQETIGAGRNMRAARREWLSLAGPPREGGRICAPPIHQSSGDDRLDYITGRLPPLSLDWLGANLPRTAYEPINDLLGRRLTGREALVPDDLDRVVEDHPAAASPPAPPRSP